MDVRFDSNTGKWVGFVDGKAVFSSSSKYYVKQKLRNMTTVAFQAPIQPKIDEFGINKRFSFVENIVDMVATKTVPSVIVSGEGGLGKTYTVLKSLENAGLKNVTDLASFEIGTRIDLSKSYRVVKGYSTAKGLFRTLQESNGMTIVMDDCDSVLKDPVALNLLKSALDSYGDRYISWMADIRDDDLDKTFKFKGQIIFITNIPLERLDQAVRTRALCVDLSMTEDQKLERMEVIAMSDEFLPAIEKVIVKEALSFLKGLIGTIPNMSLRSLISVSKIANTRKSDWKDLAKYVVMQGQ